MRAHTSPTPCAYAEELQEELREVRRRGLRSAARACRLRSLLCWPFFYVRFPYVGGVLFDPLKNL
jgi:hypothetical protein